MNRMLILLAFVLLVAAVGGCRSETPAQSTGIATAASPTAAVADPAINARIQAQIQQAAAAGRAEAAAHRGSGVAASH